MRKVVAVFSVIVMLLLIASCGKETKKAESQSAEVKVESASAGNQIAVIETEKGIIKFKFFSEDAPGTVANFIKLTESGFYNGLTFHRYEPGFVIQGGDPNGNGTGGPGYNIKAEFNKNPHIAGTVAMARSANPDSAGSQFYICLAPAPFLDRNYTVFGQVTEGMETVLKLRAGDKMTKVTIEK